MDLIRKKPFLRPATRVCQGAEDDSVRVAPQARTSPALTRLLYSNVIQILLPRRDELVRELESHGLAVRDCLSPTRPRVGWLGLTKEGRSTSSTGRDSFFLAKPYQGCPGPAASRSPISESRTSGPAKSLARTSASMRETALLSDPGETRRVSEARCRFSNLATARK